MKTNLRIGEVLMERNYITQEQMEQALAYQKEHREKRVGQILIELGFVTEAQVLEALAARLGLEIVSIGQMQVDLTAVRMIPPFRAIERASERYRILKKSYSHTMAPPCGAGSSS